ncbi:MAG: septum formation protein Maf [Bacteroidales bacterium]|nr:septum formation protein Maf [Bacteroidales bacterium]
MLQEKIKKYSVYLASQSPRRQELLKDLGVDFLIASRLDVDEQYSSVYYKEEIPIYLSDKKADAYMSVLKSADRLLITADTIVWIDEQVLGKPKDKQEAIIMLKMLSGKKHEVITGITLATQQKRHSFFCSTEVWFKNLSQKEIVYYVENYKPYDKAGAYGIQEWIGYIGVEKIQGSYFNVVGLPVQRLYSELEKFIDSEV